MVRSNDAAVLAEDRLLHELAQAGPCTENEIWGKCSYLLELCRSGRAEDAIVAEAVEAYIEQRA
jgi:hypothetical protein